MVKLFGSSGVRGLANIFLTPQLTLQVSMACAAYAKAKRAVVARDTRVSGPMLEDALVAGLVASGVEVYLAGIVPTPALAYATKFYGAQVGFMLTASHNPAQYNGIKVFDGNCLSYVEADQKAVETNIAKEKYALADWQNLGKTVPVNVEKIYSDMIQKAAQLKKNWNIIVDPGCGATYSAAPKLFKQAGCKITTTNAQPDGNFPARSSEPNAESLQNLASTVKALGAEAGIAFDGDGDRVAFVDEKGVFVDFDRSLAAYCAYALGNKKGGTVVTTIEASMCVEKMVEAKKGKVVRVPVGDIYVSEAIQKTGAVFGGEPCGAWVNPKQHLCPDGPLSALLLLKALEDQELTLSEFVAQAPEFVTLRENLACKNEQKYTLIAGLEEVLKKAFSDYTDYSAIDGVRLALKNGWLLVRASGTEPKIRLTVEGESVNVAKTIMSKASKLISKQIEENA